MIENSDKRGELRILDASAALLFYELKWGNWQR